MNNQTPRMSRRAVLQLIGMTFLHSACSAVAQEGGATGTPITQPPVTPTQTATIPQPATIGVTPTIHKTAITGIAAGWSFAAAIKRGRVFTWGTSYYGQLGLGSKSKHFTPVEVPTLTGVSRIAAGTDHCVVIKEDDTVWAWGLNGLGQLGDGTREDRSRPIQIVGLTDVVEIAAGGATSVALKRDGTLWAWGAVLGATDINEVEGSRYVDGAVHALQPYEMGLRSIRAVSVGPSHALAVQEDGTVWAWGFLASAEPGDKSFIYTPHPIAVAGIENAISAAAGGEFSAAVLSDGTAWVWGQISGLFYDKAVPAPISTMDDVTSVSLGWSHMLILKADGTVWSLGNNYFGQLGIGNTEDRDEPAQVPSLHNVVLIEAENDYSLALQADGALLAWGNNDCGQLGNGTTENQLTPVRVPGI